MGVAGADLVVVCTPVGAIVDSVRQVAAACAGAPGAERRETSFTSPADFAALPQPRATLPQPRALITDVGSTKGRIVGEIDELFAKGVLPVGTRYVGSHPIAGSEQTGVARADAELFHRRVVVVTPTPRSAEADVAMLSEFWAALGAEVRQLTPDAHDAVLAVTSHMPHVVAFALAACVPDDHWPLSAGGLRDTTRIAASDAELWTQILLSNRDHVLEALERYEQSLDGLRAALRQGDPAPLKQLLSQAKRKRDALGN